MSPSAFLNQIVLPTVDEYLAATGDLRRAILACVITYHIRDYLAALSSCSKAEVDRRIRALCALSSTLWRASATGRSTSGTEATSNSHPATKNRFQFSLSMSRGRGGMRPAGIFLVWRSSIRAIAYLSTSAFAQCSGQSAGPFPRSFPAGPRALRKTGARLAFRA